MKVLLVADQRHAFTTRVYAKKLARRLEKAGHKPTVIDGAEEGLHKADIVHIHYHPAARKLRHVMRMAEEATIPVVVTYHEVLRVPPEREAHVRKCIERTRYAFFLSEADRQAAIAINPRLKENSLTLTIPAPNDLADAVESNRPAQWKAFLKQKKPQATILYCDDITPESGLDALLEAAARFPEGLRLRLAGTVPPGGGKYAKQLKARVDHGLLPVELVISKRTIGLKQLAGLLEDALFAYLPNGNPRDMEYSGATLHPMLLPCYAACRTLVLSHPGQFTTEEVEPWYRLVPDVALMAGEILRLHAEPEEIKHRLRIAQKHAQALSWKELAQKTIEIYASLT